EREFLHRRVSQLGIMKCLADVVDRMLRRFVLSDEGSADCHVGYSQVKEEHFSRPGFLHGWSPAQGFFDSFQRLLALQSPLELMILLNCVEERLTPFLALRHGTRSVDEYEREFTRLGVFVLDLVSTETKRAHRFTYRLLPAVRHNIVDHGVQTYARTVAIAQEVDASIRREAIQSPAQLVAQPPVQPIVAQPSKNQKKRKFRTTFDDRRTRPRQTPASPTCGKRHRGKYLVGQNICFFCRQPGHISPNYPERLQQQPQQ
ncbi:Unknown protein, partial [Striga hermonthica]